MYASTHIIAHKQLTTDTHNVHKHAIVIAHITQVSTLRNEQEQLYAKVQAEVVEREALGQIVEVCCLCCFACQLACVIVCVCVCMCSTLHV